MQRSNSDNLRSASDIENSLPAKIPPHQNFQSVTAPQKQGESQATKKPRANTPNTSRKVASNSLQVAAVNSVKNHILKLPNDTDSDDFVVQNPVQIADESLSWNQVTGMIAGRHDDWHALLVSKKMQKHESFSSCSEQTVAAAIEADTNARLKRLDWKNCWSRHWSSIFRQFQQNAERWLQFLSDSRQWVSNLKTTN